MDIRDRIKTFEDAQVATGRTETPDFSIFPEDMQEHFDALYKMYVIIEALNEGWKPNWDNDGRKYYPWFYMVQEEFTWFGTRYGLHSAVGGHGSRLQLKSPELAEYAATQFKDIWKKIQLK